MSVPLPPPPPKEPDNVAPFRKPTFILKCKACGKTFPIAARISVEKRPLGFGTPEITRVIIEKHCCPFCESLEIEEEGG